MKLRNDIPNTLHTLTVTLDPFAAYPSRLPFRGPSSVSSAGSTNAAV